MVECPHCDRPLELTVEPATVPVHRDGEETEIEPDTFRCAGCEAVLFATVSRELGER